MDHLRGSMFVSMQRWIETHHPEDHRAILAELDEETRQFFKSPIKYNAFFPTARYARMLEGLQARKGREALAALSIYLAEQDLKGIFLVFARLLSKAFLIERMGEMWHKFHTEGELELISSTPTRVGARVRDLELTEAHRYSTEIYMRRVLELATRQTYRSEQRVLDGRTTEYWYHLVTG